ncbi:MAG: hypothetical protein ACSHW1_05075 [Yoonia sp.]|uniref:hypothetical protein n=1 Tax=Yoonia sp. TaxID=2212373 RepID=UPI003EF7C524
MVVEELDQLRDAYEGCQLIAFGDLSTQMILITDSQSNLTREALDQLCAQASLVLGSGKKVALGTQPSQKALLSDATSLRVFLRASAEPHDVLCCLSTPDLDVERFVADADACLRRISEG